MALTNETLAGSLAGVSRKSVDRISTENTALSAYRVQHLIIDYGFSLELATIVASIPTGRAVATDETHASGKTQSRPTYTQRQAHIKHTIQLGSAGNALRFAVPLAHNNGCEDVGRRE